MKSIIVAKSLNNVIGVNNSIPWIGNLPADMKHFRNITKGHTVIMGRKTYESIGRPLPDRQNIVLSSTMESANGILVAKSINEALAIANQNNDIFIIGGQNLYESGIDIVDRLYVTEIDKEFEGDTYFPVIDSDKWYITEKEHFQKDDKNEYSYSFITYDKKRGV